MTVQQESPPQRSVADWDAIEQTAEYRELQATKRRFVLPATGGYLFAYFGFLIAAGVAPDLFGTHLYRGITLGWVLLAGLFALVWTLVFLYGRVANRRWDPLTARVARLADEAPRDAGGERRTGPRRAPSRETGTAS